MKHRISRKEYEHCQMLEALNQKLPEALNPKPSIRKIDPMEARVSEAMARYERRALAGRDANK